MERDTIERVDSNYKHKDGVKIIRSCDKERKGKHQQESHQYCVLLEGRSNNNEQWANRSTTMMSMAALQGTIQFRKQREQFSNILLQNYHGDEEREEESV